MDAMIRPLARLTALLGFSRARAGAAHRELIQQRNVTDELISHLQARVAEFRSTTGRLVVFWGRSYAGLGDAFQQSCVEHLSELERLRADLDLAMQGAGDLKGRKLRNLRTHVKALWVKANELRQEIDEREQFWRAEAEWALSLLGERSASIWPPEPKGSGEVPKPPGHLAQCQAKRPRMTT